MAMTKHVVRLHSCACVLQDLLADDQPVSRLVLSLLILHVCVCDLQSVVFKRVCLSNKTP